MDTHYSPCGSELVITFTFGPFSSFNSFSSDFSTGTVMARD